MRRRDKSKNIDRANLLAEQRYLKSKGLLKENSVTQALMGSGDIDPQGVKNIGLIQTIQKLQEGDETIVENAIPLNQWVNPQQRLSAGGYLVFTEYNGEYFRGTARMVHGNIDSVKDVASIPQERYETYLQMYNQRHSDLRQDDTINESGMAHAAGFADGGSGFEDGATMMQDNGDVLKEDSDTYFETLSATLDHVREMAKEMGYELDEDDVNFQFGTGGIPYGQTKSATIPLLKDGEPIMGKSGKPLNRAIRVSIYRMDSGRYELTAYKTF